VGGLLQGRQGRRLLLAGGHRPPSIFAHFDISENKESATMIIKPHVSLNVSDIDASVAFYERAFGVAATKRRPGYAKFDLQGPLLNLTMQEAPRTGVNASHFGVQVSGTADVNAARERFAAAGLAAFSEDDVTCCYATQDKVWVEDPDGNAWEVFVVKADAETMREGPPAEAAPGLGIASAEPCCAPGCCVPSLPADAR
jgi:catechol 2,3-dioxygenase-like lactoylglutathione lyase family enzyme